MIPDSDILAVFRKLFESDGADFDVEQDLDPFLRDVELYPHEPLLQLGTAVGDILEKKPAVAIDIALNMVSSTTKATRALACLVIGRLARHGPAHWMSLARHLAVDEIWEVREYTAYIFDTRGDFEGIAAFHLDYCFEVLTSWIQDSDYRVRSVAANALLGFFLEHPEIGRRLITLVEPLLSDGSDYARRHLVGTLRTIGKKEPEMVFEFIEKHLGDESGTTNETLRLALNHRWTRGYEELRDKMLKGLERIS